MKNTTNNTKISTVQVARQYIASFSNGFTKGLTEQAIAQKGIGAVADKFTKQARSEGLDLPVSAIRRVLRESFVVAR